MLAILRERIRDLGDGGNFATYLLWDLGDR